jgi:hypothetical protein
MLFISAPLSLERLTSLDVVIPISPITRTYVEYPNKSHYSLKKHVESKHLSTQLVHVFTELRTKTLKRGPVSIHRCTSFLLIFFGIRNQNTSQPQQTTHSGENRPWLVLRYCPYLLLKEISIIDKYIYVIESKYLSWDSIYGLPNYRAVVGTTIFWCAVV